ncbi:MAG: hypothetical protein HZC41_23190 [Chloroflexi bacterium]|nr:hypothetical protein [Chloroflexota bacterium]
MSRHSLEARRARTQRMLWRIAAVVMFIIAALLAIAQIQYLQQQGAVTATPPLIAPEVLPEATETSALLPTHFEG